MKTVDVWEAARLIFCRMFCRGCTEPVPAPKPVPRWRFAGAIAVQFSGDFSMQLKDNAIAMAITVAWLDAAGKTAKVQDGSLKVVSSDPNLVTVEGDAANGFTVKPGPLTGVDGDDNGILGTAQITATADADLGDGVTEVAAVGAITVVTSDAVVGTLSIGGQPA